VEKLVSIFIQVTKALLEQGDPFSSGVSGTKRLRFSIGTFLLVAIVISNAYKSSNVYNLVLPRKPVPFENLSQLLSDSFKIYSKAIFVDTHLDNFGDRIVFTEEDWKYIQSQNYSKFFKINVWMPKLHSKKTTTCRVKIETNLSQF